jgi:nitroimidazol reductase NimA-like FMN-containing flavoprotein (pyridoxamine 5'-phosphate oxidase superfamily)
MADIPMQPGAAALAAVLSPKSAWNAGQAIEFLEATRVPLRLSTLDAEGYPHITSLWSLYVDGHWLCCTQRSALACLHLRQNPRVGFEIAVCAPPYRGLSGQGEARVLEEDATTVLEKLADRFLEGRDRRLRQWLLSRVSTEVIIRITPRRVTSWDFQRRMSAAG